MKYLIVTLMAFSSFATFAADQNCVLRDVGHVQLGNKFSWTQSHVTVRKMTTASIEGCMFMAREKLGTEYDAEITYRTRHRNHTTTRTRTEHFKVTEVRYKFSDATMKSKGKIKIPFKDWN